MLAPRARSTLAAQNSFVFGADSNLVYDSTAQPRKTRVRTHDHFRPVPVVGPGGNALYKAHMRLLGEDLQSTPTRALTALTDADDSISCLYRVPGARPTFDSPLNKVTLSVMMRFGVRHSQVCPCSLELAAGMWGASGVQGGWGPGGGGGGRESLEGRVAPEGL